MKVNPADLKSQQEKEIGQIYASLQAVNDELDAIEKDQQGFNYKFRGINQVMNTLGPLFKKHKILVRRSPVDVKQGILKDSKDKDQNHATILINYHFVSTIDGSELVSFGLGEGLDKGDKSIGCSISNAYKYVIFEMFNIPTEEQIDSDQKTAKEEGIEKASAPRKKVTKTAKKSAGFRKKKVSAKKEEGEL